MNSVSKERARRLLWLSAMRWVMAPLVPMILRRRLLRVLGINIPSDSFLAPGTVVGARYHSFGNRVLVNVNCHFDGADSITVRDDVRIGARTVIITGSHTIQLRTVRRDSSEVTLRQPVTIERGCWVGSGCTVLPGVTIASGCVIAAGSVVNRSTEPDGLYVGTPARRIRDLTNEDRTSEALQVFDTLPLLRENGLVHVPALGTAQPPSP